MEIEKLQIAIKADIDSKLYTLQNIFDRNFEAIDALNKTGITHPRIFEHLELSVSYIYYKNLIFRSRKKFTQDNSNIPLVTKINIETVNKLESSPNDLSSINYEKKRIEEWNDYLGYEISERVYSKIVELNLNLNDITMSKVPNSRRLLILLNELLEKRKYK